jgi:hypothetical protein
MGHEYMKSLKKVEALVQDKGQIGKGNPNNVQESFNIGEGSSNEDQ